MERHSLIPSYCLWVPGIVRCAFRLGPPTRAPAAVLDKARRRSSCSACVLEWSVGHRQLNLSDSRYGVDTWNQSCTVIREHTALLAIAEKLSSKFNLFEGRERSSVMFPFNQDRTRSPTVLCFSKRCAWTVIRDSGCSCCVERTRISAKYLMRRV
ncbi:hypothetical protein ARMGADRAFT_1008461 [Armillaria gallica]|uniref:Uncharacterized protein n=1 Tax=Armillaria gallica TaxID=47427 RepID=A0A2H3ELQ7_ARMGA|nr:hypothetical protein ARMGADRAFT_1008461 [Armillaria gallica]